MGETETYRIGTSEKKLLIIFQFLRAMSCNSRSVARIITGFEKGIGERLHKMNKLIVNMELIRII